MKIKNLNYHLGHNDSDQNSGQGNTTNFRPITQNRALVTFLGQKGSHQPKKSRNPKSRNQGRKKWINPITALLATLASLPLISILGSGQTKGDETYTAIQAQSNQVQSKDSTSSKTPEHLLANTPEMKLYIEELRNNRPFLITSTMVELIEQLETRPLNPNTQEVRACIEKLRSTMPKPGTPEMAAFKQKLTENFKTLNAQGNKLDQLYRELAQLPINSDEFKALTKKIADTVKDYRETHRSMAKYTPEANLDSKETQYAKLVNPDTVHALLTLYRAEQEGKVDVVFAGFTPSGERVPDGGFSPVLRIVKRYGDIYVNEHWHVNEAFDYMSGPTGGARLPDIIRVHYKKFPGAAGVPGSERNHVYDEIVLIWNVDNEVEFYKQKQFRTETVKNEETGLTTQTVVRNQTRSRVSVPSSCLTCHNPNNTFKDDFKLSTQSMADFLANVNHETIVQNFDAPPEQQKGYREYIEGLKKMKADPDMLKNAEIVMKNPKLFTALPNIVKTLESLQEQLTQRPLDLHNSIIPILGSDEPVTSYNSYYGSKSIYENSEGKKFDEAATVAGGRIGGFLNGLDQWWFPQVVFPPEQYELDRILKENNKK